MTATSELFISLNLNTNETANLKRELVEHPKIFVEIAEFLTVIDNTSNKFYENIFEQHPDKFLKMFIDWQKRKNTIINQDNNETWKERKLNTDDFKFLEDNHNQFNLNTKSIWDFDNGCTSVQKFVERMQALGNTSSKASLENRVRKSLLKHKLIGYKMGNGSKSSWKLPIWQIDKETGNILNGISDVCTVFNSSGYAVQEFMTSESLLDLKSNAITLLKEGRIKSVVDTAKVYENY